MPKILIADDDPAILDATKIFLEDEGYEVITAADGETIIKAWKENPDLVLLDIWMPGMDGEEVCLRMKQTPQTAMIPVIMVSASRDTVHIANTCGANDYLVKPYDLDDLLQKVKKFT